MITTIRWALLVAFAGASSLATTTDAPGARACALAMAVDGYTQRVYLPKAPVEPEEAERAFIRMRERTTSAQIALLWLQHWGRARLLRIAIDQAKGALGARLLLLGLDGRETQLLFLTLLSDFDLAEYLMNEKESAAKVLAIAALLNSPLDPETFFPSTEKSGLGDKAQYLVYDELFLELSNRLGLRASDLSRDFETWFRGRKECQPFGKALYRFLKSLGVEL